jgi:hypothetical protein
MPALRGVMPSFPGRSDPYLHKSGKRERRWPVSRGGFSAIFEKIGISDATRTDLVPILLSFAI